MSRKIIKITTLDVIVRHNQFHCKNFFLKKLFLREQGKGEQMRKVKCRCMPERASTMDIRTSLDLRRSSLSAAFNTEGTKPEHM